MTRATAILGPNRIAMSRAVAVTRSTPSICSFIGFPWPRAVFADSPCATACLFRQPRLPRHDAVAAGVLGGIQRLVGAIDERGAVGDVGREHRDTEARGDPDVVLRAYAFAGALLDLAAQPLRDGRGLRDVDVGQHDAELLAAVTAQEIAVA